MRRGGLGSARWLNIGVVLALSLTLAAAIADRLVKSRATLADAKMVLMTAVMSDADAAREAVSDRLRDDRKVDPPTTDYRQFLDPDLLRRAERVRASGDATALLRFLVGTMSPDRPMHGCGDVEGLRELVTAASRDYGCCSDYSKVLMTYALAFGVPVRETNNIDHTTVEYFDAAAHRWLWIDPTRRIQAFDATGSALGQREIRSRVLGGEPVIFRDLTGALRPDLATRAEYGAGAYRVIAWTAGTNLAQQDATDRELRRFRLAKAPRQFLEYLAGVRPGYIGLAAPGLAGALQVLRLFAWVVLVLVVVLDVIAVGRLARWLWQAARQWVGRGRGLTARDARAAPAVSVEQREADRAAATLRKL